MHRYAIFVKFSNDVSRMLLVVYSDRGNHPKTIILI